MKDEIKLLIDALREAGVEIGHPAIDAAVAAVFVDGLSMMGVSIIMLMVSAGLMYFSYYCFRVFREKGCPRDDGSFAVGVIGVIVSMGVFAMTVALFFNSWVKVFTPLGWLALRAMP